MIRPTPSRSQDIPGHCYRKREEGWMVYNESGHDRALTSFERANGQHRANEGASVFEGWFSISDRCCCVRPPPPYGNIFRCFRIKIWPVIYCREYRSLAVTHGANSRKRSSRRKEKSIGQRQLIRAVTIERYRRHEMTDRRLAKTGGWNGVEREMGPTGLTGADNDRAASRS